MEADMRLAERYSRFDPRYGVVRLRWLLDASLPHGLGETPGETGRTSRPARADKD